MQRSAVLSRARRDRPEPPGGLTVEAAKDLIEELIKGLEFLTTWIELVIATAAVDLYFDLVLDGHPRSAQLALPPPWPPSA